MAPIQTHRAHCGACAGLMVLIQTAEGYWYACNECPAETTPRPTAAEADADVVWVPASTPAKGHKHEHKRA